MIPEKLRTYGNCVFQSLVADRCDAAKTREYKSARLDIKAAEDLFQRAVSLDQGCQPPTEEGFWLRKDTDPAPGHVKWTQGCGARTTENEVSYTGDLQSGSLQHKTRTTYNNSELVFESQATLDYDPRTITWHTVTLSNDFGTAGLFDLRRQEPESSQHTSVGFAESGYFLA